MTKYRDVYDQLPGMKVDEVIMFTLEEAKPRYLYKSFERWLKRHDLKMILRTITHGQKIYIVRVE